MKNKKTIVVITLLSIAAIFVLGADWANETIHRLFHSYYADIALPFGFYLLLIIASDKLVMFQSWKMRALSIFLLCALSETMQYFGVYALARTFDPIDYVMYALGVVLAIIFDRIIFKGMFNFWN